MSPVYRFTILAFLLISFPTTVLAQFSFEDRNGDGEIKGVAVGDSITFGVGDGVRSGEFVEESITVPGTFGYPGRLEGFFGFLIDNKGEPGERLTTSFPARFSTALLTSRADYVFILGGSNDAILPVSSERYRAELQTLINISKVMGVEPILLTIPPTCCDRAGLTSFTRSYSREVRELGAVNEVIVADIEVGFDQRCPNLSSCSLLNRPEGLHPNTSGYDFIAEVIRDATVGPPMPEIPEGTEGNTSEEELADETL